MIVVHERDSSLYVFTQVQKQKYWHEQISGTSLSACMWLDCIISHIILLPNDDYNNKIEIVEFPEPEMCVFVCLRGREGQTSPSAEIKAKHLRHKTLWTSEFFTQIITISLTQILFCTLQFLVPVNMEACMSSTWNRRRLYTGASVLFISFL